MLSIANEVDPLIFPLHMFCMRYKHVFSNKKKYRSDQSLSLPLFQPLKNSKNRTMENPNKLEFETINTNQIFYNNNKNKKIKIQIRSESKPTTISTPQKLQK